jgi:hypothetical protein
MAQGLASQLVCIAWLDAATLHEIQFCVLCLIVYCMTVNHYIRAHISRYFNQPACINDVWFMVLIGDKLRLKVQKCLLEKSNVLRIFHLKCAVLVSYLSNCIQMDMEVSAGSHV